MHCSSCWRCSSRRMRNQEAGERPLLALLAEEERQALWASLPQEAREALVVELARLMVWIVEEGAEDEAGESDPGTAP